MTYHPTAADHSIDLFDALSRLPLATRKRKKPAPLIEVCRSALKRAIAAEAEIERLKQLVESLAQRIAAQSELLAKRAEKG